MLKQLILGGLLVVVLCVLLLAGSSDWRWSNFVYKAHALQDVFTQPYDQAEIKAREQRRAARLALAKTTRLYEELQSSLNNTDVGSAISALQGFIEQHPDFVQAYLDLATHYAADGQLSLARQALINGLKADSQSALLYANLQKVQGTLAANAYKSALNEEADIVSNLELPAQLETAE